MDGGGRRGRYYEPQAQSSSSGKYDSTSTSQTNRVGGNTDNHRLRPSALTSVSSAPRTSSGHYEPTAASAATGMSSTGLTYGTDYSPDTRLQSAGFSSYGPGTVMYNVAPPGAAQGQVYDSPAFASRPSAGGMQMMIPEVASTYFGTATPGSTSHSSVTHPNVYQQAPGIGFATSMPGMSTMQQAPASADVSMAEDPDYADNALEERWINYKRQMASVFQDIANGALQSAADTLSTVSNWLLSQVSDLGKPVANRVPLLRYDEILIHHSRSDLGRCQPPCGSGTALEELQPCLARFGSSAKGRDAKWSTVGYTALPGHH